ncbi:MAG: hypothetical protein K5931_06985 [Lachnospiraceae bacterium]|nr:hypothetical protein [Lachnospiraceae bacterium]
MDCLIYYELLERSYDNILLIKYELEKRGYSVKLCNALSVEFWKSLFYRPKVVIIGAARSNKSLSLYHPFLFKESLVYLNMQEEQIAYSGEADLKLFIPVEKARDIPHFTWGSFAVDYLRRGNVSENNIVRVKPIQFDFCNKKLGAYFYSRKYMAKKYGLDINKKWIMFASDFVITSLAANEEELDILCMRTYSIYEKTWHAEKDLQDRLEKWFGRFLKEHRDYIIIYRPHPDERRYHDFVKRLNDKYDNFYYIGNYSIKQWLSVIDVFTTWFSTAIMEAYYAGVPSFALGDGKKLEEEGISISLFDGNKYIQDYDTFESCMVKTQENVEKYFPLNNKMVERYYGKYDYEFGYKKIADYVDDILKDRNRYNSLKVHLTRAEKASNSETRNRLIKSSLYNDIFRTLRPILWYLIPFKRKSIIKFSKELERYEKKELKKREKRLWKVLENLEDNGDIQNNKRAEV